jgi:hypothetical protein
VFDPDLRVIGDVKNVANLRATRQLEDFVRYAASRTSDGWRLILEVREDTVITLGMARLMLWAREAGVTVEISRAL